MWNKQISVVSGASRRYQEGRFHALIWVTLIESFGDNMLGAAIGSCWERTTTVLKKGQVNLFIVNVEWTKVCIKSPWTVVWFSQIVYTRYWYIWDSLNGTLDKIGHAHCSERGPRFDLSSQQKFQQNMKIWCMGFHKIHKWKKSSEGTTLLTWF